MLAKNWRRNFSQRQTLPPNVDAVSARRGRFSPRKNNDSSNSHARHRYDPQKTVFEMVVIVACRCHWMQSYSGILTATSPMIDQLARLPRPFREQ